MEKYINILSLASETLKKISSNKEEWTNYLKTSSRLYKYSFDEQLLIYAQKPNATACASIEIWNTKMSSWVKRGSKGIALLDKDSDKPKLKYVFDVSDIQKPKDIGHTLYLWEMKEEHKNIVLEHLESTYGHIDNKSFEDKIIDFSKKIVAENYNEFFEQVTLFKDNSYLEELDSHSIDVMFRTLLESSLAYNILNRCGTDPDRYIEQLDFDNIYNFNTVETLTQLGNAATMITKPVLMQIGRIINAYEFEKSKIAIANDSKVRYNTLKRESIDLQNNKNNEKRGNEDENCISTKWGLSNSRNNDGQTTETDNREIWKNEKSILNGEQKRSLYEHAVDEHSNQSLDRDQQLSNEEIGIDRKTNAVGTDDKREIERNESDGMGSENEQYTSFSRGNNIKGTYTQLTLFPTINQQQDAIKIGTDNTAPISLDDDKNKKKYTYMNPKVEVNIPHDYIVDTLKRGSGFEGGKFRIEGFYKSDITSTERSKLIKKEYGLGGCGWPIEGFGLHGYDSFKSKGLRLQWKDSEGEKEGYITWTTVEKEIGFLVEKEEYITDREKERYAERVLKEAIDKIVQVDKSVVEYKNEHESNFLLDNGDFFVINTTDNGYDYTFYDSDMHLIDGGILESNQDKNIMEVTKEIIFDYYGNIDYSITDIEIVEKLDTITSQVNEVQSTIEEPISLNEYTDSSSKDIATNFRITNDNLGVNGVKDKYKYNIEAIKILQKTEHENRVATSSEQEILSKYVGWGGLSQAYDEYNTSWSNEYQELKNLLSKEEYASARESTLNAHYTSPTIIRSIYNTIERMGFTKGNILEPAMGTGNFFGMLPDTMSNSKLYGVELDDLTGRIAKQLYPNANIKISGFETTEFPNDFFDIAIGNVPFGQYKVSDKTYDKNNFLIHDYFFAKTIDKVRPGGVIAFISSKGTLDKQNPQVRKYLAQRAELLGAVRLPNNAFLANAGTEVTSDILFFKKRDRVIDIVPNWVHLSKDENDIVINEYFVDHPEMIVGKMELVSGPYGLEPTCQPIDVIPFEEQLNNALGNIYAQIENVEINELNEDKNDTIPADPNIKNYSFTTINDEIYFRENSVMVYVDLPEITLNRIKGMVEIRNCTNDLIQYQLEDHSNEEIQNKQEELTKLYDNFTNQFGLINSQSNKRAFNQDSSYCLLCSLEKLNDDGSFKGKADMFTRRTIKRQEIITNVDTSAEALAVCLGEKARIDLDFMSTLTGKSIENITNELEGVIFLNPINEKWETADEYLSGNVREKLNIAKRFIDSHPEYAINVTTLEKVQPKLLDASEIEIRLGATWIEPKYIDDFMEEVFETPKYHFRRDSIGTQYSSLTGQWNIKGKNSDSGNILANMTYGTSRANAYKILEDSLNLRDVRIFDTVVEDGKEKRVLNKKETMLASQKQESMRDAFKEWIFKDLERREVLCTKYNDIFNSTKPREYDGNHLKFPGMTPDIVLKPHQKNAVAHVLYGDNTLLAHCVGSGKTFEMTAAAMESKRLGLCQKSLFVVPNHLTEQWASDFLRLYPGANILAATKKDFEPANRKKFCSRITTGDYDAVIIGHTQFEKIPLSIERQRSIIERQIDEIVLAIDSAKIQNGERYTIKQMEKTKKSLDVRLDKLNDTSRKDDVVTFEQLGVDKLFVDESHNYKNLFLYTKMRNVAGIAQTEAQKSSDMFAKCQYLDELTNGKGITFATGTPISNSMTELYTNMRYLQYSTLQRLGLGHFDSWAATFGETITAIELAPEGTGYRAKTRFAKFFNLPELINLFKECADIQTSDMLNLPVPEVDYHNIVLHPSEHQKNIVLTLAERAESVRNRDVDASVDNMLKITNDGRKLALDQRLINNLLPDETTSKSNACVENAYKIWDITREQKSTQLIFCDLSTPKFNGSFNVYEDIKKKLLEKDVPESEISFIHEANTENRKAELFAKVRSGQVRFLLGSTAKMGAGTNVQDKLVALHHLDVPWRPSDIEQQEGRILRQGNENEKVDIFRYVTEGTFDSYSWQLIENKQKFISQIMTSKSPLRSCEDIDETTLSYAEVKALATGNPYIKEKMDLDIQVSKLKILRANYISQQYKLEDNISKHYPADIQETKAIISAFEKDIELYNNNKLNDFSITINNKVFYDKKEAGNEILELCKAMKATESLNDIGKYRGFSLSLNFDVFSHQFTMKIKNAISHTVDIGSDTFGNITRIDNCLENITKKLERRIEKLDTLYNQLKNAKLEAVKPFIKEYDLQTKQARLNELNSLLNMDKSTIPVDVNKNDIITDIKDSGFKSTNKLVEKIVELSNVIGSTQTVKDIKLLTISGCVIDDNSSKLLDEIVKEFKTQEIRSSKYNQEFEL